MCFNKEFTLVFSGSGVLIGAYILSGKGIWASMESWRRTRIAWCFFYFSIMEGLQFVDYLVIDQCSNIINIIFTQLGYLHIAFQPIFSNFALSALDRTNTNKQRDQQWKNLFYFCFGSGLIFSLRMIIPLIIDTSKYSADMMRPCNEEIEGICGEKTCSTTGVYHMKWAFKLLRPSYMLPSMGIHFLNMFLAPFVMGIRMGSVILFLTGPFIANFFEAPAGEQAAIWCFFSIMEAGVTMFSQYLACRNMVHEKKMAK